MLRLVELFLLCVSSTLYANQYIMYCSVDLSADVFKKTGQQGTYQQSLDIKVYPKQGKLYFTAIDNITNSCFGSHVEEYKRKSAKLTRGFNSFRLYVKDDFDIRIRLRQFLNSSERYLGKNYETEMKGTSSEYHATSKIKLRIWSPTPSYTKMQYHDIQFNSTETYCLISDKFN